MIDVALYSTSTRSDCTYESLKWVADALQLQNRRDVVPIWGSNYACTVVAYRRKALIPSGVKYIIGVYDDVSAMFPGAAGIHLDSNSNFVSYVQAEPNWSKTASHELIEMLVDPYGNRLSATVPYPPAGDRPFKFLVEPCDPCEALGYRLHGFLMSDFITPDYYNGLTKSDYYNFLRTIQRPQFVLPYGYLSFMDTTNQYWYQVFADAKGQLSKRTIGVISGQTLSIRQTIETLESPFSGTLDQSLV